jgi:hypothetical protein
LNAAEGSPKNSWLPLAVLGGLFLFGFALCGTYVFLAGKFCPIEIMPRKSPLSHLLVNYGDIGEQESGTDGDRRRAEYQNYSRLTLLEFSQANAQADKQQQKSVDEHSQGHSWIIKFFCEAKAADVALVFFTYGLMIVTGWLAWATLKLWKAGEDQITIAIKAANAADLSARAAIALQLPIIRIKPDELGHGDSVIGGEYTGHCSVHQVIISNLGSTKAFPKEIAYGWTFGDEVPAEPSYQYIDSFLPNFILEADPKVTPRKALQGEMPLKAGQWSEICKGNNLWFYCALIYDDFMGESHSHGFWWRWSHTGKGMDWRVDDTPAYNRKT